MKRTRILPESEYLDHIQQAFPNLDLHDVSINREGMVNVSVIVNRERVFRFPRAERSVALLRQEMKALDLVRQYVDMPVPHWDYRSDEMISYPFIPGGPLLTDDLLRMGEREQDAVADLLATFLKQMHSIPMDKVQAAAVQPSETVRSVEEQLQFYEDVRSFLFPLMWADGREWVRRLFAPVLADHTFLDYNPTFMNGDLGVYHLLFDRQTNRFNGIIDFGTAGIGDPAQDLGIFINQYGESFLRRMNRTYPKIEQQIDRARFYAGKIELEWILRGIREKANDMFVVHLGRMRDAMPVGSGW